MPNERNETPQSTTATERDLLAANAALKAYRFFRQMEGACYRSAMFVRLYLKEKCGTDGQMMVGFVNDGQGPIFASHAWYEFDGKRTDLALAHPNDASTTPPGPLVIHGVTIAPGHPYSYHETVPEIGLKFLEQYKSHPMLARILRDQGEAHAEAAACANDDALSRAYLDKAPDGWGYQKIVAFIEETPRG